MIMLRAAELERVALCPGSYWATQGIPYRSSPEAEEGTLMHKACETGQWEEGILEPEQEATVRRALDIRTVLLTRIFGEGSKVRIQKEKFYKDFQIGLSGKFDWVACSADSTLSLNAVVGDWKFGRGQVEEADSNLQVRAYAVLAQRSRLIPPTVDKYFVVIIQPRVSNEPTICEYGRDDIERSVEQIVEIRKAAEPVDAPRTPSPQACRFCAACGTDRCPESQRMIAVVSQPVELQPERLSRALKAAAVAEGVIKQWRASARAQIEGGVEIPGWDLVPNSQRAHFTDVMGAWARLQDTLEPHAFADACKVTMGVLEEKYREKFACTWEEAKRGVRFLLRDVIEMRDVAPSLKQVDD